MAKEIWRWAKISVFLTLDCSISAIKEFSCKSLNSCNRLDVFFPLQGPRIFKSMPLQRLAVTTHTHIHKQTDYYNPPPIRSG